MCDSHSWHKKSDFKDKAHKSTVHVHTQTLILGWKNNLDSELVRVDFPGLSCAQIGGFYLTPI